MSNETKSSENYQPEEIRVPPLYAWPPKPLAALKYLFVEMLYPWGFFYLVLAFPTWWFLTRALETMANFEFGWIALLWLRNAVLLLLLTGGLHWYLHASRCQGDQYRINRKSLAKNSRRFLWGNQVRDNMFWNMVSGVSFWTAFEAISYWVYASGRLPIIDNPWYFCLCLCVVYIVNGKLFYHPSNFAF